MLLHDHTDQPGQRRKLPHVSDNGKGVNHAHMRGPMDGDDAPPPAPNGKPAPGQTKDRFEKFPAPWFGGKSRAAATVWAALGDVEHYVEPFCGSAASLLCRPHGHEAHRRAYYSETINDLDGLLVNAFRAMQADPEAVAGWAAWPVSEADLHARHAYLLRWKASGAVDRLSGDPGFYDARVAGWWLWGQSSWIGSGWCSGSGPWVALPDDDGVLRLQKRAGAGGGQWRKLPHVSDNGKGVNHAHMRGPMDTDHAPGGPDWPGGPLTTPQLRAWMRRLSDRLRWVRILHGDWKRACTSGAMNTLSVARMASTGHCGVFLDPPYADTASRDSNIYAHDDESVAHDVREWCLKWQATPWLRIVLAGFEGEHNDPETGEDILVRAGWRCVPWYSKGYLTGGMGNLKDEGKGIGAERGQMHRERLWLSPNCLAIGGVESPAATETAPAPVQAAPALYQAGLFEVAQ